VTEVHKYGNYHMQWTAKILFLALSVTFSFFLCESNISGTAERICTKLAVKTCLVPRSDESECQGQRSKVRVTRDKNWVFGRYLGNRWTDLQQIHTDDMFGTSLGWVWRSRSKVKITRHKKRHFFGPFSGLRAVCAW